MLSAEIAASGIGGERRVVELDGLRGLMTLGVIVSHYFGELPHGLPVTFGWIAVDMFFVLSGFLIGKLILDKHDHRNFFQVFYIRRCCRIIPAYVITVVVLTALIGVVPAAWFDTQTEFPLWSYLSFTQTFFMISSQTIGNHWLAPTWTLAFEEHFYLVAPALIAFTPRRWLLTALIAAAFGSIAFRAAIYQFSYSNHIAGLVLLPARADLIVCGVLAALLVRMPRLPWQRMVPVLRAVPAVALIAIVALVRLEGPLFDILNPLLLAVGCSAYLLCIVRGLPEARLFRSKVLQFVGNNGYCLYLTHLPVLGLMHGALLGAPPDLATPDQWVVTLCALPVCLLVGWGMTAAIEEPMTRYGRSWRWSPALRSASKAGSFANAHS